MAIAKSRATAKGQITVPADVRRKLGFSTDDIHQALFGSKKPEPRSLDDLKDGIRSYVRKRYPRG
jgi:bifunctional DNA-binding transcriptional regulator/antitoxin component of YhaV-PrlF toxin-antitoxin module